MTVSASLVDRDIPAPEAYLVGREKVREFALATLTTDPRSHDLEAARAAGFEDLVAPPTFAIVVAQRALDVLLALPDSGIVLERTIHGEEQFVYDRAIVAGDVLTPKIRVESVRSLGSSDMIVATITITDAADERVATATSTLMVGRGDA